MAITNGIAINFIRLNNLRRLCRFIAVAGIIAGCSDSGTDANTRPIGDCRLSEQTGWWLLPFGPLRHEVSGKGHVELNVVVIRQNAAALRGRPAPRREVEFRALRRTAEIELERPVATTDDDGVASTMIAIAADAEPDRYQFQASLPGTCPQTFSVTVRRPVRQLKPLIPSPYDTYTNSRVPIAVEAITDDNGRLANERVTFRLSRDGDDPSIYLVDLGGKQRGKEISVTSTANGRATALLVTGDKPASQVTVEAEIGDTAALGIDLRVSPGNGPCESAGTCPLGYHCANGLCEAPPQLPPGGCSLDEDCPAEMVCQELTGRCLEGTSTPCDPIEGTGCPDGEVCVGNYCARMPARCDNNGDCPAAFRCTKGACTPHGKPPGSGCSVQSDCPADEICLNGACAPKNRCHSGAPDRLEGVWLYDSKLRLRDALSSATRSLLKLAGMLRDLLHGGLDLDIGLPDFLENTLTNYLERLMEKFVPAWAQQLIVVLGNLDDILDQMRVLSVVRKSPVGDNTYLCSEEWTVIEFNFQGRKISSTPESIPEVGPIRVHNYLATEVCGTLFIDKHEVRQRVKSIAKWALHSALSMAACASPELSCRSIDNALAGAIQCQMLGAQMDQLMLSFWGGAPPLGGVLEFACEMQKMRLLEALAEPLGNGSEQSPLELSGTAPVNDEDYLEGNWHGVLRLGAIGGNFDGSFTATRQDR